MTTAASRCSALDTSLQTCALLFGAHNDRANLDHDFQDRMVRKTHIPWLVFGQEHAYCGRRPHHYADPEDMRLLRFDSDIAVRVAARSNLLCTACFKNWMYLKERNAFIGVRTNW